MALPPSQRVLRVPPHKSSWATPTCSQFSYSLHVVDVRLQDSPGNAPCVLYVTHVEMVRTGLKLGSQPARIRQEVTTASLGVNFVLPSQPTAPAVFPLPAPASPFSPGEPASPGAPA